MLSSQAVWKSMDVVAQRKGVSLPRLALMSDLDQAVFSNARRNRNWMSLMTLAKVLNATEISVSEWAKIVEKLQEEEKV